MDGSGVVEVLFADLKTLHEELGRLHAQATRAASDRQAAGDDGSERWRGQGAFRVPSAPVLR